MGLIFSNLQEKPNDDIIKKMIRIGFILVLVIYAVMAVISYYSGTDLSRIFSGQLSFSKDYLVDIYWTTANLDLYQTAQIIDYAFMVAYGASLFALSLKNARKLPDGNSLKKIGFIVAELAVIAAICDAFENAFILMTLMNPLGFEAWLAIAHSCFALIKWILLFLIIIYNVVAVITKKK